jgi:hypothetical protein
MCRGIRLNQSSLNKAPRTIMAQLLQDGKVTEDFGVYAIDVARMEKLPMVSKRVDNAFAEVVTPAHTQVKGV